MDAVLMTCSADDWEVLVLKLSPSVNITRIPPCLVSMADSLAHLLSTLLSCVHWSIRYRFAVPITPRLHGDSALLSYDSSQLYSVVLGCTWRGVRAAAGCCKQPNRCPLAQGPGLSSLRVEGYWIRCWIVMRESLDHYQLQSVGSAM